VKYISLFNLLVLVGISGNFVIGDDDIADCTFCPPRSKCIAGIPNAPDTWNTDFGWVQCMCREGYTGDGWKCEGENECMRDTPPCPSNAFCVDTAADDSDFPGYKCGCLDGLVALTTDDHGAARCGLPGDTIEPSASPLELTTTTPTMMKTASPTEPPTDVVDDDEINRADDTITSAPTAIPTIDGCTFCPPLSKCVAGIPNAPDQFATDWGWVMCLCKDGYIGDGWICEEEDECVTQQPCPTNSFCVNTAIDDPDFPRYKCGCMDGLVSLSVDEHGATQCGTPGETPEPTDSPQSSQTSSSNGATPTSFPTILGGCGTLCPPKSICVATDSSNPLAFEQEGQLVTCLCREGYVGDGWRCDDANECELYDPCPSNAYCVDTNPDDQFFAQYLCGCNIGFEIAGVGEHGVTNCRAITSAPTKSPTPAPTKSPAPTTQLPTKAPLMIVSSINSQSSPEPTETFEPSPSPSIIPSMTSKPSVQTNERISSPTVSNSPSDSESPSMTSVPSQFPSISIQPSVTNMPSSLPSLSNEPSMTDMPSDAPSKALP